MPKLRMSEQEKQDKALRLAIARGDGGTWNYHSSNCCGHDRSYAQNIQQLQKGKLPRHEYPNTQEACKEITLYRP